MCNRICFLRKVDSFFEKIYLLILSQLWWYKVSVHYFRFNIFTHFSLITHASHIKLWYFTLGSSECQVEVIAYVKFTSASFHTHTEKRKAKTVNKYYYKELLDCRIFATWVYLKMTNLNISFFIFFVFHNI